MSAPNESGTPFEIAGAEGEVIRGNVHLPSNDPGGKLPVVLVLHGFKGYKDYGFFPYLTQSLADSALVAIRLNFSHSGIDDDYTTFGRPDLFERDSWGKQLFDVEAAIAALPTLPHADRMDPAALAILGHSRGGVVVLLTGGSDSRIKAVVGLSASSSADMPEAQKRVIREDGFILSPSARTGQDLRIGRAWIDDLEEHAPERDVLAAVARMKAPLMIVHGTDDESVPIGCADAIAAAYPGDADKLILEGAGHTFNCTNPMSKPSPALEELIARVGAFLHKHLNPDSSDEAKLPATD